MLRPTKAWCHQEDGLLLNEHPSLLFGQSCMGITLSKKLSSLFGVLFLCSATAILDPCCRLLYLGQTSYHEDQKGVCGILPSWLAVTVGHARVQAEIDHINTQEYGRDVKSINKQLKQPENLHSDC